MRCAHSGAALSHEKIPIGRFEALAREGAQSPRMTAHVFARVTNRKNSGDSFLRRSSHSLAMLGFAGAGGQYEGGRDPWSAVGVTGKWERHCVSGWRAVRVQRASSAAHRSRRSKEHKGEDQTTRLSVWQPLPHRQNSSRSACRPIERRDGSASGIQRRMESPPQCAKVVLCPFRTRTHRPSDHPIVVSSLRRPARRPPPVRSGRGPGPLPWAGGRPPPPAPRSPRRPGCACRAPC